MAVTVVDATNCGALCDSLLAKGRALDLLRDAHVVKRAELALVIDVDVLLVARGRVRDVELQVAR